MMSGRAIFFAIVVVGLAWIGFLLDRDGWEPTWSRWGMVSRSPFFSDLRVVTGAMDSIEKGYDPMISNPGSPWHQRFNQPRLWLRLMDVFEIRERHSAFIGLGLLTTFLAALWTTTAGIPRAAGFYCGLIFFSSATLLAIERCNLDLLMFVRLAVALACVRRSAALSLSVVFVAFMLKLFPLAGLLLLLREPRRRALTLASILLLGVALYFALTFPDLQQIWKSTEKGADISYGYNVLWHYLRVRSSPWTGLARVLSYVAVALSLVAAWWRQRAPKIDELAAPPNAELDAYRLGAGIYTGTFLLGNSWDYRLIFFFFAVPQLFRWLRHDSPARRWLARGQLTAFAVDTWAMALTAWLARSTASFAFIRGLEEAAKWTLFATSLWLLAATLPGWARDLLRFRRTTA